MRPCCFRNACSIDSRTSASLISSMLCLIDSGSGRSSAQAVADPRRVVERPLVAETAAGRRARRGAPGAARAAGTARRAATRGSAASGETSATTSPSVLHRVRAHFEARSAGGAHVQDSLLRHVPVLDAGERSDAREFRRGRRLSAAPRRRGRSGTRRTTCRRGRRPWPSRCSAARRSAAAAGRPGRARCAAERAEARSGADQAVAIAPRALSRAPGAGSGPGCAPRTPWRGARPGTPSGAGRPCSRSRR